MRKPMKILILLLLMIFILNITLSGCKAYQRSNPSPEQLLVRGQNAIVLSAVIFVVIAVHFVAQGFKINRNGDYNYKKKNKRNHK